MICLDIYSNELFVPVFGFGAKTFPGSSTTSNLFPMSMNMSNPLIPNQEDELMNQYATCLSKIQMDLPVKIVPTLYFIKNLQMMIKYKQKKLNTTRKYKVRFP